MVILFVIIIGILIVYYPYKKSQDAKKSMEYYYPGTAPRAGAQSKPWWLMDSREYQEYVKEQRQLHHGKDAKPPWIAQQGSQPIDLEAYGEMAYEPEEIDSKPEPVEPAMVVSPMKDEPKPEKKKKPEKTRSAPEKTVIKKAPKKKLKHASGKLIAGIPETELISMRMDNEELNTALYDLETKKAMGKISKDEFEAGRKIVIKKHLKS
jgi:hypothetical protein